MHYLIAIPLDIINLPGNLTGQGEEMAGENTGLHADMCHDASPIKYFHKVQGIFCYSWLHSVLN